MKNVEGQKQDKNLQDAILGYITYVGFLHRKYQVRINHRIMIVMLIHVCAQLSERALRPKKKKTKTNNVQHHQIESTLRRIRKTKTQINTSNIRSYAALDLGLFKTE